MKMLKSFTLILFFHYFLAKIGICTESEQLQHIRKIEGLQMGIGITQILQGSINSDEDETDISFSVDIEIEKEIGENAKAYLHLEGGKGEGLNRKEYSFSLVNTDAVGDESLEIAEFWYEHYFKNFAATIGKLDATCYLDQNNFANDETTQFLNDAFKNNQTIEFPDNTFGMHFLFDIGKNFEIEVGFFDGDADYNEVFNDIFAFFQINLKPNILDEEGDYRFFGWVNDISHTEFLNPTKKDEENYGLGLSFDQCFSKNFGIFARFGWQNGKVAKNEYSWSLGFNISPNLWKREKDNIGIAFGQNIFSNDYKKVQGFIKTESIFEIYYNYKISDWFTVSPDIQLIQHPAGKNKDTMTIIGLRGQLSF